jgi:hypothetical protein
MKLDHDDYVYMSGPGVAWAEFQLRHGSRKIRLYDRVSY